MAVKVLYSVPLLYLLAQNWRANRQMTARPTAPPNLKETNHCVFADRLLTLVCCTDIRWTSTFTNYMERTAHIHRLIGWTLSKCDQLYSKTPQNVPLGTCSALKF